MQFIKPGTNINFVGRCLYAYGFSLALILVTIISLAVHKGPNLGVDFSGGLLVQVKFNAPTNPNEIRDGLVEIGMADAEIQRFGAAEANEFLIRTSMEGVALEGLETLIEESLTKKYEAGSFSIRRVEMVGPKVGQDLRDSALFALFYAILFILIYISGRFELKWGMSIAVAVSLMAAVWAVSMLDVGIAWLIIVALLVTMAVSFLLKLKFALGAIVALIHDVTITVGVFSLLNLEITLPIVAALLTIVGYSLNDTIIVFDRIRENMRKFRKAPLDQVINTSINETLSRTILTSGTTLAVVICLAVFGGPVIRDFAYALITGIAVGTYSSIFVASPILLLWPPETRRPKK